MRKKLQVFISSTFTDLQEERQAAVQAILSAGHIPAGMELFKAGDKSQKETIKRWIDESDVYMLILGGRYGSIDSETGMSYTHWEYDYACKAGKRLFAVVITEEGINAKGRIDLAFIERDNYPKYQEFRHIVLSNISKFFDDVKDIKLAVLESLREYEADKSLTGWISGKDVANIQKSFEQQENSLQTTKEKETLNSQYVNISETIKERKYNGLTFIELKEQMINDYIEVPAGILSEEQKKVSLLVLFPMYYHQFASGVTNSLRIHSNRDINFFYHNLGQRLIKYGLAEKTKAEGGEYEWIKASKLGFLFLTQLSVALDSPDSSSLYISKN